MSAEDRFSLERKTILVTGASSGIGRQIAISCAERGAAVMITARRKKVLDELKASLPGEGHCSLPADLTSGSDITNLVDNLPTLDGVIHCAGVSQIALCKNITEEIIDTVFAVNFKAPVLLQAELIKKGKLKKGSSVVLLSSITASTPMYGNAVYSASKGALLSYAKCLGLELAKRDIRVNCICPAMVWTDLITKEAPDLDSLKETEKEYPLKRFGSPVDISDLAVYLLSDASSWMTGSAIDITGGKATLI